MGDNPLNTLTIAYMANENEIIDSTNDTEVVASEETTAAEDTTVDAEKLKEINRKLFERAKKAELELKSLKTKSQELSTNKIPKIKLEEEVISDIAELKLSEKKRQIGYKHGLSPEETDKLFAFAGKDNPEEALKDTFFQAGLKEYRAQKRVNEAIPSSTNRSTKIEGKTFSDMSDEERAKNWSKLFKK